ncbi:MAG: hypothetical protein PF693_13795 [Spirochaetia bacterium]|jgi:hypothetical protein|nr:hypothetical protein [Spirochaetia bacterium]
MSSIEGCTVKELKQWLSNFSDDMIVVVNGNRSGYDNILYPEIISVRYEEENNELYGMYEIEDEGNSEAFDVLAIFRNDLRD